MIAELTMATDLGDVPRSWFCHFHGIRKTLGGFHCPLSSRAVTVMSITDVLTAPRFALRYLPRLPAGVHSGMGSFCLCCEKHLSIKVPQ